MTDNENSVETQSSCFGCVLWMTAFIVLCILAVATIARVWNWAF